LTQAETSHPTYGRRFRLAALFATITTTTSRQIYSSLVHHFSVLNHLPMPGFLLVSPCV
jgi:hypothetical protein